MAGQHHVVGEDDTVADVAIVANVRVSQESTAIADDRLHAPALRAGVDGDSLTNDAGFADLQR